MPLRHWLQLSLTAGIGPILGQRIVAAAGSAQAACDADADLLNNVEGIGLNKSRKILTALRTAADEVDAELARAEEAGVTIVSPDDTAYPILLRSIPDPPLVLYVKGELQDRDLNAVAIVGSRKCSFYGREQAERFGALLAGSGVTVLSGGARGVDSSAHRGALSHPQGRTIAVLGSGIDVTYPPENRGLFDQIAERGAVLSEFAMGTEPARENFPRRNRVVSGMSRGVLVIEADERSGALITARQACDDHGRPVFALPGKVDNPLSAGPHLLIRDGAVLVRNLEDVLEGLTPLPDEAVQPGLFDASSQDDSADPAEILADTEAPEELDGLTDQQRKILTEMNRDECDVDSLIERTQLPAHTIMQDLTYLTLKGRVRRLNGQMFKRTRAK